MFSLINDSPYNIQRFSAAKLHCKTKVEQNQVCEVRLIPGINLFHFLENRLRAASISAL